MTVFFAFTSVLQNFLGPIITHLFVVVNTFKICSNGDGKGNFNPLTYGIFPLTKISLGNQDPKIVDLSKLLLADVPMPKK